MSSFTFTFIERFEFTYDEREPFNVLEERSKGACTPKRNEQQAQYCSGILFSKADTLPVIAGNVLLVERFGFLIRICGARSKLQYHVKRGSYIADLLCTFAPKEYAVNFSPEL